MSKNDNLMLAHLSVQAARAAWEASGFSEKYGLTYGDIRGLFNDVDYKSLRDIGKLFGVSGERSRQIYNKFVRESFGGQSRRSRWLDYVHEKHIVKMRQAELELLENPVMRTVIEKARAAGCVVEPLPRLSHGSIPCPGTIKLTALLINGCRCSVHHPTAFSKSSPRSKRLYGRVALCYKAVRNMEGLIVYTNVTGFPEHTFVIRSSVLRRIYFTPPHNNQKDLTIPTEKLPIYNNKRPLLNIWEYENAWHHLSPKL